MPKRRTKTQPLEVHTHGHVHATKKWKEYLFQFLMLFLAVTLSFIVENAREHYIEDKRARVLAVSMYSDLEADTMEVGRVVRKLDSIDVMIDLLHAELRKPRAEQNDSLIHSNGLQRIVSFNLFDPQMVTYEQAKTSGSLRYFNQRLVRSMSEYENDKNYIMKIAGLYLEYWGGNLVPFCTAHWDMRCLQAQEDKLPFTGRIFSENGDDPVIPRIYANSVWVKRQFQQQVRITKAHEVRTLQLMKDLKRIYDL